MRGVVRLSITIGAAAALFLTPTFGGNGKANGNGNGNGGNGGGANAPHARSVAHGRGRVLGVVQQTNLGHIDQSDAQTGSNIYSCEDLTADETGTMRVRVAGAQIYISSQSSAELEDDSDEIVVLADSGTVGFSEPSTASLIVRTPAGIVRAEGGSAAAGEVTYKSATELVITAMHGNLTLDSGGELRTIPEGKSADVMFEDALTQACHRGAAPLETPNDKIGFFILVPAALMVPSYILWQEMTESDSKPHHSF
jgi:hypothetical protein